MLLTSAVIMRAVRAIVPSGAALWLGATSAIAVAAVGAYLAGSVYAAPRPAGYRSWALATRLEVPVYNSFDDNRRVIGLIRRGDRIPVRLAKTVDPCVDEKVEGQWLETPGGFVCTSSGITVGGRPSQLSPPQRRVNRDRAVPFSYVKVESVGAPRYDRPGGKAEHVVEEQTKAFFLAKDAVITRRGKKWLRTVYGEYVELDVTRPVVPTQLRGVELNAHNSLPIAFVIGPDDGVITYCPRYQRMAACGRAAKHSRFKPAGHLLVGTQEYVLSARGKLYEAEYVRTADEITRPEDIPDDARWVHINLDEQTFVAYEGDVPHYTSLISSGVEGRDTPDGLYRTQRKYVSKTMRGPDETHGRYRVEEIPWVMYYHGAYAVHGAYWHNQFGEVRSHGCTNIAPVDAQWLFDWDQTPMREGWHANLRADGGLYLYFSSFEQDDDAGAS